VLRLPGRVNGFSSSVQNRIHLILILACYFENQYLISKLHFGFEIIQALNVKTELAIFRKEYLMS